MSQTGDVAIGQGDALLVVDVQNDFCPGGALPVPHGDGVVAVANTLLSKRGWLRVASRDWHPANHCSFRAQGGPWPPHCVQNTPGAEFHPGLNQEAIDLVVSKADRPDKDAYSAFEGTGLAEKLRRRGVKRVFVLGLATDYCVKSTAIDAVRAGFRVFAVEDGMRGVEVTPGDSEKALAEMRKHGVELVRSEQIR